MPLFTTMEPLPPTASGIGASGERRTSVALLLALVVTALASFLAFDHLGADALRGDEALHAEVARESTDGSWLPLTYDGDLYLSKPPLKILAVAWLLDRFGDEELEARVVDAACGVATVLVVFLFGARWLGPWAGALAATLLATMPDYLFRHGVRAGVQDSALVLFVTVAILLYFEGVEAGRRRSLVLLAGVALGLASLVKGPAAALALPVLVAWEGLAGQRIGGRRAAMRDLTLTVVVAAACYLPYLVAALAWSHGRFLHVMRMEVVVRVTESVDPNHLHGPAFYFEQLAAAAGLWLLAALPAAVALRRARRPVGRARALALAGTWAVVLLLVPLLSRSKLPWYLYPSYPGLALLLAGGAAWAVGWIAERARGDRRLAPLRWLAVALLLAGLGARLDAVLDRLEQPPRTARAQRYAEAIRRLPSAQVVRHRDAPLSPADLFYLAPIASRSWGLPKRFRTPAHDGCRFFARANPALPPALHPAPDAQALPLDGRGTERAWLLDLDGCLWRLAIR